MPTTTGASQFLCYLIFCAWPSSYPTPYKVCYLFDWPVKMEWFEEVAKILENNLGGQALPHPREFFLEFLTFPQIIPTLLAKQQGDIS